MGIVSGCPKGTSALRRPTRTMVCQRQSTAFRTRMTMRVFPALPLCLFGLLLTSPSPRAIPPQKPAPFYVLTDLGAAEGFTLAHGINDKDQVVGVRSNRVSSGGDEWIESRATLWENCRGTDLGAIPDPLENRGSTAFAINRYGQIVGSTGSGTPLSMSGLGMTAGFLYEKGRMRLLQGEAPWNGIEAHDINDRGWVAGVDAYRAFLWRGGRAKNLATLSKRPAGNRSRATALNERVQVVGATTIPQRKVIVHAFLWEGGRMRDLGALRPEDDSMAHDINERGQVIGSSGHRWWRPGVTKYAPRHAFLWEKGRMIDLGTLPNAEDSEAFALNDRGEVVGKSGGRAVLWRNGRILDLNALIPKGSGWTLVEARDINNRGQIVGAGRKKEGGELRAFLLKPRS